MSDTPFYFRGLTLKELAQRIIEDDEEMTTYFVNFIFSMEHYRKSVFPIICRDCKIKVGRANL